MTTRRQTTRWWRQRVAIIHFIYSIWPPIEWCPKKNLRSQTGQLAAASGSCLGHATLLAAGNDQSVLAKKRAGQTDRQREEEPCSCCCSFLFGDKNFRVGARKIIKRKKKKRAGQLELDCFETDLVRLHYLAGQLGSFIRPTRLVSSYNQWPSFAFRSEHFD